MIPSHWTPYRRPADSELVGYLVPEGDGVVPVTLFGYPLAASGERAEAERVLAGSGLSCLADSWSLDRPGQGPIRVKIREVTADRVVVVVDDFGAGGNLNEAVVLPVPAPAGLTPLSRYR